MKKRKEQCPDTQGILSGLKDFQRKTVEYVYRRMYTDEDRVNRFLVADEVGLGKTLVARGLIAKAIEHLWPTDRRIDVVYVCSNAEIARQNIGRLNVTQQKNCSSDRLRLDFGSNGITGSRTTNTGDGFYRLLVDGNGDGDYIDAVDSAFEFVRILGETTGNAVVDAADLAVVNAQFGRSASTSNAPGLNGDTDGSGAVNNSDRSRTTAAQNRALATPLLAFLDD